MSPVDVMKVSATQLRDLPGNQLVTSLKTTLTNPLPKYRQKIKAKLQSSPSEHFRRASNDHQSQDCWEAEHSGLIENQKPLATKEFSQSNEFGKSPRINTILCENKINSEIEYATLKTDASKIDSEGSLSGRYSLAPSESTGRKTVEAISDKVRWIPPHQFSAKDEQKLLEELLQFDEDEEDRIYGIQADEDIYKIWKSGESRRLSKNKSHINSAPRGKAALKTTSDGSKFNGGGGLSRSSSVPDIICGWETIETSRNKKIYQKNKEDRKIKTSLPFSSSNMYSSKYGSSNESGESPFMFFHYTDIARYIQQYRKNHVCENACASHPSCCHKSSSLSFQDVRDFNFPYKFDLSTNSITHRGTPGKLSNQNSKYGLVELSDVQSASNYQVTSSPFPDHRSAPLHKPPTSVSQTREQKLDKMNNPIKGNLQSMWDLYERGLSKRQSESPVKALNTIERRTPHLADVTPFEEAGSNDQFNFKTIYRNASRTSDRMISSVMSYDDENDVEKQVESTSINCYQRVNSGKNNSESKQPISVPRMQRLTLEDSVRKKKNENSSIITSKKDAACQQNMDAEEVDETGSEEAWQFGVMSGSYLTSDTTRHSLKNKNIRMRSLIAAEIKDLQKRRVISIEQKQKLDRFKQALSQSPAASEALPPSSGSSTRNAIAGSVRAYYTRTAHQDRHISTCEHVTEKRNQWRDEEERNPEDTPVIVVSQPHLRHQSKLRAKPDSPMTKRKLIGGRSSDLRPQHPADTKQFTRITDLLRIKKRQQDNRHSVSGISRATPDGSSNPKRHLSPHHHGNSAKGRRLKVVL